MTLPQADEYKTSSDSITSGLPDIQAIHGYSIGNKKQSGGNSEIWHNLRTMLHPFYLRPWRKNTNTATLGYVLCCSIVEKPLERFRWLLPMQWIFFNAADEQYAIRSPEGKV